MTSRRHRGEWDEKPTDEALGTEPRIFSNVRVRRNPLNIGWTLLEKLTQAYICKLVLSIQIVVIHIVVIASRNGHKSFKLHDVELVK